MKIKKFHIQISEPCLAKKEALAKTDGGFNCNLCNKYVGNYTNHSKQSLNTIINNNTDTDFCGIFTKEQLSAQYTTKPKIKNGIFSSLIFSSLLFITKNAIAQSEIQPDTIIENTIQKIDSTLTTAVESDTLESNKNDTIINTLELTTNEIMPQEIFEVDLKKLLVQNVIVGFTSIEPIPTPFEKVIDSAKTIFYGSAFLIGRKMTTPEAPNKKPINNNDKPSWFKEFRNLLRRKRKNRML